MERMNAKVMDEENANSMQNNKTIVIEKKMKRKKLSRKS